MAKFIGAWKCKICRITSLVYLVLIADKICPRSAQDLIVPNSLMKGAPAGQVRAEVRESRGPSGPVPSLRGPSRSNAQSSFINTSLERLVGRSPPSKTPDDAPSI
ncbi:hypothetical protein EVG20_g6674 [Dentipellis fragilis]|uniref:Uncharacterized protein n=1 Tax=Dentipellis fragilis TaxID=205917 RepID=A0A4Y9YL59_9AGAM|nr:hypothetical protein EVG20_g6674 [Dentipellis fragilis]